MNSLDSRRVRLRELFAPVTGCQWCDSVNNLELSFRTRDQLTADDERPDTNAITITDCQAISTELEEEVTRIRQLGLTCRIRSAQRAAAFGSRRGDITRFPTETDQSNSDNTGVAAV